LLKEREGGTYSNVSVALCSCVVVVFSIEVQAKNVQVKKVQSDQYARVSKHGRMLSLINPNLGLLVVEL
jgi:hypothetical protein